MQPVVNRRHCLSVLIVVLVICSAVLLNVVYELAKNFAALHRTFWTSYINHSLTHVHVPVWPSGFFPHNTYGFHPLNEHGVWCTLFTCVLVPCFIIIIITQWLKCRPDSTIAAKLKYRPDGISLKNLQYRQDGTVAAKL